jgi:pimeloyl-ACP methyl ester carboxylesterase
LSPGADSVVSPYDRLVWPPGAIEALLASGERRRELVSYFGEAEYDALHVMARAARHAVGSAGAGTARPLAVIIPGIMGSQLGYRRLGTLPVNLLWIDPVDFQHGGIAMLRLPESRIVPLGVILYSYLRLKLGLEAAGFETLCFDYDWRRSLHDAGERLARRLVEAGRREVSLVGHSLGGLVARVAASAIPDRVARVVTLGAPHQGSWAALQALRGVHATVRRIAQIEPVRSAEQLASHVFSSFPSLYELLPPQATCELVSGPAWPHDDGALRRTGLAAARRRSVPDVPLIAIAGTGQDTVTAAEAGDDGEVSYVVTRTGDGTVPTDSAAPARWSAWYVDCAHSELPRDARVIAATASLLRTGRCALGSDAPAATPRTPSAAGDTVPPPRRIHEAALRRTCLPKLDWSAMTPEARRAFLDDLNAPLVPPA